MISETLLSILRCPTCRTDEPLILQGSTLICETCRLAYPIVDGIPQLIKESAVPLDAKPATDDIKEECE